VEEDVVRGEVRVQQRVPREQLSLVGVLSPAFPRRFQVHISGQGDLLRLNECIQDQIEVVGFV
jgi:hypothetical protein